MRSGDVRSDRVRRTGRRGRPGPRAIRASPSIAAAAAGPRSDAGAVAC